MNAIQKIENTNVPWQGLGSKINPKDSIEESLAKAGLNWEAKRTSSLYNVNGVLKVSKKFTLYRGDTDAELGSVSDKYNIAQPSELIQSYKDLAATKGWPLEYMGEIDKGVRIWALAKTDKQFKINNHNMTTYLLLTTTYDGSSGTVGKFISLDENMASISMSILDNKVNSEFRINHKVKFDLEKVAQKLNSIDKSSKKFQEAVKNLSNITISDKKVVQFLLQHFERKNRSVNELSTRQSNILQGVIESYKSEFANNNFGLIQSIAKHVDFNVGRDVNNRMRSSWFGLSNKLKTECFNNLSVITN